MDMARLEKAQTVLGWITAGFLLLCLACLADALAAGFKDEGRLFHAVPGSSVPITAILPMGASTLSEMRVHGGDADVALTPDDLFTGFWLGGTMWRGSITIGEGALPGQRTFTLEGPPVPAAPKAPPPQVYTVVVYADAQAMQEASPSFVTRLSGQNPFVVSLCLFLLALPAGAGGYLANWRLERLLTEEGKGIVYMVKQTDDGLVITFSLGTHQGLSPGMGVRILNAAGLEAGHAEVTASMSDDAVARLVSGSCAVGDMVVLASGAHATKEALANI